MRTKWLTTLVAFLIATMIITNTQLVAGSDEAIVKIVSSTSWTGSIIDSSFDSATKEGRGPLKIPFVCSNGLFIDGIYSLVFQKLTDHGILTVSVIQDNQTLDSKSTTAAYGVVSLSGNCGG